MSSYQYVNNECHNSILINQPCPTNPACTIQLVRGLPVPRGCASYSDWRLKTGVKRPLWLVEKTPLFAADGNNGTSVAGDHLFSWQLGRLIGPLMLRGWAGARSQTGGRINTRHRAGVDGTAALPTDEHVCKCARRELNALKAQPNGAKTTHCQPTR